MANNKDIFAPPTKEELDQTSMFAPPTKEELGGQTSPNLETAQDIGISAADAATLGLGPRVYAGLGAAVESGISGDEFGPTYSEKLKEAQDFLKEHQERSPIGSAIGGVVGGAATGGALMKGLGSIPQVASAVGGLESLPMMKRLADIGSVGKVAAKGITSAIPAAGIGAVEGAITGGAKAEEGEVLPSMVSGAQTGGVLGGILGGTLGSAGESLQQTKGIIGKYRQNPDIESKRVQQLTEAFGLGEEGKALPTYKGLTEEEIPQASEKLQKGVVDAWKQVRNKISGSIEQATKGGQIYDESEVKPILEGLSKSELSVPDKKLFLKSFGADIDPQSGEISLSRDLTPQDIFTLKNKLNKVINAAYENKNPLLGESLDTLRQQVNPLLSKVEGYDEAVKGLKGFSESSTDVLLSGKTKSSGGQDIRTSDVSEPELRSKINDFYKDLIIKSQTPGVSKMDIDMTYKTFLSELKKYGKENPGKLQELGLSPEDIVKDVFDTAKRTSMKRTELGYDKASVGMGESLKDLITSPTLAHKAGQVSRGMGKIGEGVDYVFRGGKESYPERAQSLIRKGASNADLQDLKAAMDINDTAKVNALTNSILQRAGKKSQQED